MTVVDATTDVTQNCVAFPQIALRCGAMFLQHIPLTASVSTNYHVVPEMHFCDSRRNGLRNAACVRIVKYRTAKLQLCFLLALSPAFATDRFKVSGFRRRRRRRNYNISADTCARYLRPNYQRANISRMGRRGGARRTDTDRSVVAAAVEISTVKPCFNESRVLCHPNYTMHASPSPRAPHTPATHKTPSIALIVDFARSIDRTRPECRSNNCNFTLAW